MAAQTWDPTTYIQNATTVTFGTTANKVRVNGATAGNAPTIEFTGTDTNVGGGIITKGNGALSLMPGGVLAALINFVAGATRWVTISGSNAGNPVISTSAGSLELRSADNTGVVIGSGFSNTNPVQVTIPETSHATSKRTVLQFGSGWRFGQDMIGNGVKDFYLYCVSLGDYVLRIATNGVATFFKAVRGNTSTLTGSGVVTPDFSVANYFQATLTGNITLDTPTNYTIGQGGSITFRQDGSGNRVLSGASSIWKFPGGTLPVLSTGANAVDKLVYECVSGGEIHATLIKDFR
ncbi:hypothetical protein [Azospirillum endophyticum]